MHGERSGTYRVSRTSTVQDRVNGVNLIPTDVLAAHLPLHELLVREEVHAVACRFTEESDALTLENPSDTVPGVDLLDSVEGAVVYPVRVRLNL